jgi:pimeloyl-ACP methyl ester carboxylesterase
LPFFIFNGEDDNITPTDQAKKYFDAIEAPHKEFVALKGGGHSSVLTMPDVFLRELVKRVRPVALNRN